MSDFMNMRNGGATQPDPDTFYYLKTAKPHIHDISISGPYYPFDNIVEQIRYRLTLERSQWGTPYIR